MNPATKQARVPEQSARAERGSALRIAGWLVLLSNIIVLFYMPAAEKLGQERPYQIAVAVLIVTGVLLIAVGTRMRRSGH